MWGLRDNPVGRQSGVMSIRVALLDDNEPFRRQLTQRLAFFPQIEIVFSAATAHEFFELLGQQEAPPDVALVDIELPDVSGIEVAACLAREHEAIGALMLTVFEEPRTILAAIQAGAAGYLLKDSPAETIANAIAEVHEGGVPLSRPVARNVLHLLSQAPPSTATDTAPAPDPAGTLSAREVELLEQIVQGDTESAIAKRLCISPHTVRTHVKNIYRKLRVNSRAAAVRVAYEQQLLDSNTRFRR